MLVAFQVNLLSFREDLMLAMFLIPFSHSGVLVHVLDDLAPPHAGVVSAEGDLAFLGRVRNDAHLSAAEIVVEEILEPHASDEKEVPGIFAPFLNIGHSPVGARLPVITAGDPPGLIKL